MKLSAGLVLCLVFVFNGLVEGRTGDVRDPEFQEELNRQFAEAGVDSSEQATARGKHRAFVGSSERARELGNAYLAFLADLRQTSRQRTARIRTNPKGPNWETGHKLPEVGVCSKETFKCDSKSPYRTADGSCNNLDNPTWGQSFTQMRRFLPSQYEDGKSSPRVNGVDGSPLPSARLVSTTVHSPDDNVPRLRGITHMLMQWGQFLDHDLTLAPVQTGTDGVALTCCQEDVPANLRDRLDTSLREGCFPIDIPPGDRRFPDRKCMNFPRSILVNNAQCTGVPAEQLNQLTAYVDASNVYGSDEETATSLRTMKYGLLKTSDYDLLPFDNDTMEVCVERCFKGGDERANEQMGLASMHTIFMREHNRVARTLYKINPNWDDERLYQEARRILGAIMQKITYNDFLPLVLNKNARIKYGLVSQHYRFSNVYDKEVDASIRNGFAAAAYRFGHSLLRSLFSRLRPNFSTRKSERLRDLFGNTKLIIDNKGQTVNELLRGELVDRASRVDRFITLEVTDHLFATLNMSLDLASLNNQRGRDHGVPGYTQWRTWCGLSDVTEFGTAPGGLVDHDVHAAKVLQEVYRNPQDIDLFSGGLSETPVPGGLVGPTFTCILANQFSLLKRGDRFWFETDDPVTGFTAEQLHEIRKASLSRIICDNTDTFFLQKKAFRTPSRRNPVVYCQQVPRMNLYKWAGTRTGTWSDWSSWSGCRYGAGVRFRTRLCRSGNLKCFGPNRQQSLCYNYAYFLK